MECKLIDSLTWILSAHLTHSHAGRRRLQLVEEELEVADDDELAHPALLHPARLRHLHVALVRRPDPPRRVDAQGPLGCKRELCLSMIFTSKSG